MANVVEMDYFSSFKKQLESEGIDYVANQIDFDVAPVDCLRFLAELHRVFGTERVSLLDERVRRSAFLVAGGVLTLPQDTESIRCDPSWRVQTSIPPALKDRTVDIVCMDATTEQSLIACMTSGANGVQVDFDDGFQCGWQNVRNSHTTLKNVVATRTASETSDAVLLVRPRSLNLSEFHVLVDGAPVSGSLFDFGVHMFHSVKSTIANKECDAFPERSQLGLNQEFLLAYYKLLVAIAHQRGIAATGGMSPLFPSGAATELSPEELESVYKGKLAEAELGFDGALVAHRSAVEACRKAFSNRSDIKVASIDGDIWHYHKSLLAIPKGDITLAGVNSSITVLVLYILKWLKGVGATAINGVVEDLATAEINRALLWRWIRSHIKTKEGVLISFQYVLKSAREIAMSNNVKPVDFTNLERVISILLHSHSFIDFMPTIMYPFVTTIQFEAQLGTLLEWICEGVVRVTPKQLETNRLDFLLSSGIHGNETAPIELMDKILQMISTDQLIPVGCRLLFIYGNPDSIRAGKRFIDVDINRLFNGRHSDQEYSGCLESKRAELLERISLEFFTALKPKSNLVVEQIHYDMHTAIRGSKIEKFAIYPKSNASSPKQLARLAQSDLEAVVIQNEVGRSFSWFTHSKAKVESFTLELGKASPFKQNQEIDLSRLENKLISMIDGSEGCIDLDSANNLQLFKVSREIIKKTDSFKLNLDLNYVNSIRCPVFQLPCGSKRCYDPGLYTCPKPGLICPLGHVVHASHEAKDVFNI
ncbi:malate synthase [Heterostelium album PN500]|uniref:malate synthase n=1 Tax=Heterostelium pallidum (strain ATCC 26659 / Pp 5 / PN500) TaxID=670386 RepID=D3BVP6_HETP5|nr:malate synthase [Heterostelium album PN500]EFA74549.1 malate synthase [Heterostelium album PN500]|eukprot:XP_020426683.1 malate synthase [Heterostelium album PN500]